MGRPAAATCLYPHLPEGCYAARIGTVPVDEAEHRRLMEAAANIAAKVEAAVTAERLAQLQMRGDVITALNEQHAKTVENLEGQLSDARGEVKDREERIRLLLTERHADVGKLGELHQQVAKAEHRDAQITADGEKHNRDTQLQALKMKLDNDLIIAGGRFIGTELMQIAPLLLPAMSGKRKVVDTTITDANGASAKGSLAEEPPPLCFAIAQLMWRIRDPELVGALAIALARLAMLPALQGLGGALSKEAPDAFAVVAALVQSEAAKATSSTSAEGTAPSASHTNGTNGAANGATHN